jgi:hypothetical protein
MLSRSDTGWAERLFECVRAKRNGNPATPEEEIVDRGGGSLGSLLFWLRRYFVCSLVFRGQVFCQLIFSRKISGIRLHCAR